MTNIFLKFSVSILTFTLGVLLVGMFSSVAFFKQEEVDCCSNPNYHSYPVNESDTIEVRVSGYGRQENRPTLKFEIINHSLKPAKYIHQIEGRLFVHVKFNGSEIPFFHCGTGAKEYEIRSGESLTMEITADVFFYRNLRKKGKFQVGFYLKLNDKFEEYWSDEFQLSESLTEEIIKNAPDFMKG